MRFSLLLRVGSRLIKVRLKEPSANTGKNRELVGEFAHTDAGYEIRVAPGLCRRERSLVLLHELLHAVSDLGGSPLSERQVLALENGLGAFAVDHPDVWKEFSKA